MLKLMFALVVAGNSHMTPLARYPELKECTDTAESLKKGMKSSRDYACIPDYVVVPNVFDNQKVLRPAE